MAFQINGTNFLMETGVTNLGQTTIDETWAVGNIPFINSWESYHYDGPSTVNVAAGMTKSMYNQVLPNAFNLEAWYQISVQSISSNGQGNDTFTANVEYRFGNSQQWRLLIPSTRQMSINSKIFLHVKRTRSVEDGSTYAASHSIISAWDMAYRTTSNYNDTRMFRNSMAEVDWYRSGFSNDANHLNIKYPAYDTATITMKHEVYYK